MMLPTAGPMILTYAEIADTAARKREPAASPLVLAAGYVDGLARLCRSRDRAAVSADPAHLARCRPRHRPGWPARSSSAPGSINSPSSSTPASTLCQRPFPFFFANWTAEPRGVFRLGLRQGLLSRLLLGLDAGDVRGRRDEYRLDGGARHCHDDREDEHHDALFPRRRNRAGRDWTWHCRDGIGEVTCRWSKNCASSIPGTCAASSRCPAIARCSARACCRSASTRRPKAIARPGPACGSTTAGSAKPISPA